MTLRALLALSDRSGAVEFAQGLRDTGVELIATDGTLKFLADNGVTATPVSEVTKQPQLLGGRVKTLHPAIAAGILARRNHESDMRDLAEHGYAPIDIVVVSLYPFAQAVASGAEPTDVIEQIDIGGPTMIRAAAKNSDFVAVVTHPNQYGPVLDDIRTGGDVSEQLRRRLAADAFSRTAAYEGAIAAYFNEADHELRGQFSVGGDVLHQLRYGENPHQRGALYAMPGAAGGVAHARQHQGPELSFTNWLDVDAAYRLVCDFAQPAAAVIKHTNPCGFAVGDDASDAYTRAYECDPRSAFGGIVALNRPLDEAVVEALGTTFLEAVIAPAVTPAAAQQLAPRQRLRVLEVERPSCAEQWDVRSIDGGLLVQTADAVSAGRDAMRVVTTIEPSSAQWHDLEIAWRLCRHVKSNAIVLVKGGMAVGVGAGQMSRVEAVELAVKRAADRSGGAVAASDAFFPFPDSVEALAAAGVTAVIQPGGSKQDQLVIDAANAAGVAMVFTGERHFRH